MIKVYVLKSQSTGLIYVGMTKDLTIRLMEHNAGKGQFTKGHRPWSLIYSESFPDWTTARIREKYLKSAAGKKWLKAKKII